MHQWLDTHASNLLQFNLDRSINMTVIEFELRLAQVETHLTCMNKKAECLIASKNEAHSSFSVLNVCVCVCFIC